MSGVSTTSPIRRDRDVQAPRDTLVSLTRRNLELIAEREPDVGVACYGNLPLDLDDEVGSQQRRTRHPRGAAPGP